MKNKIIFKIIALVIALVLIVITVIIANGFVGNPFASTFSKSIAEKYINEKFSDLDLKITEVDYSFKDSGYYVRVQSQISNDTHFSIGVRDGEVFTDSYDFQVQSGANTFNRFCEEYQKETTDLIKTNIKDVSKVFVMPSINEDFYIPLDATYDKAKIQDIDYRVTVKSDSKDVDFLAKTITDIHTTLVDNGYNVALVGLTVENEIEILRVTEKHIYSEDFKVTLQKAIDEQNYDGIWAYNMSGE